MIEGKVMYVPADRSVDRATGLPYYVVLVEADKAALDEAHDIKLQAGMPAETSAGKSVLRCYTCLSLSPKSCVRRVAKTDCPTAGSFAWSDADLLRFSRETAQRYP